jgi:hypothetical protein
MGKVVIIPARPSTDHLKRKRTSDPGYMEGQRVLVDAMKYLLKSDPEANRAAVQLISEHVRTRFRMSDSPLSPQHAKTGRAGDPDLQPRQGDQSPEE